jgi:hypothetical protein
VNKEQETDTADRNRRCLSSERYPLTLEAVMNSVRNGLEMRETKITRELSRPWNPHSYAIFAQVHNTL